MRNRKGKILKIIAIIFLLLKSLAINENSIAFKTHKTNSKAFLYKDDCSASLNDDIMQLIEE